jgi:dihydrolipoamide dehydrogenase
MQKADLVVVGGGPAGYVPAIRAAQLGRSVVLVESAELGGTCLNRGCIPTKTLASTARLLRQAGACSRFGLAGRLEMNWGEVSKRKNLVVTRLRKGIEAHFARLGIRVVRGRALLKGPGLVVADGEEFPASKVLLAPGSVPLVPGFLQAPGVLTSDDVLGWESLPESLLIIGGGVIGCEFASILSAMGVKVTIVEMLPSILPGVDRDVSDVVARSLSRSGVAILTGNATEGVEAGDEQATVRLADGTRLSAGKVLAAIGRRARTREMGLEEAGVELDSRGCIRVDAHGMTSLPGVYAAGDATGIWWLAHAGSAQGIAAVHHAFGAPGRPVDPDCMPGCIFTDPEVATVGPGEEEWRSRGVAVRTGISRYIANGKAVGMNETEGFVKIIAREHDDRVVGVQIVGADASSLASGAVVAVGARIKAADWARFIHPHPTLSELMMEAAESLGIGALHG